MALKVSDVTALVYVIGVLDGFRRPPFPFSRLYKAVGRNRQTWVPRPVELNASFLNYYLMNLGQADAKVNQLWRTLYREIEAFQPQHEEYGRARRRLLIEFASGFFFAMFVLKLVFDAFSFPNWAIAVLLILLIYPLSRGFGLAEGKYVVELREQWKGSDVVRSLISCLSHDLLMEARKEGRSPDKIRIKLMFDDYDNLYLVQREGRLYTLSPARPSSK